MAEKYPERLLTLCTEFTQNASADAQCYTLAEAIADSQLPFETRKSILAEFSQKGSLWQRLAMLESLAKLDRAKCVEILSPTLNQLTNGYSGYAGAGFSWLIAEVQNDQVRRKYLQITKRCDKGLRMEILGAIDCCCCRQDGNRDHRLAFLAAFLNDKTVVSDEHNPRGSAAFSIPEISMRDFAAMQIAAMLNFPDDPDKFWTLEQWAALRKKVQDRLSAEKIQNL